MSEILKKNGKVYDRIRFGEEKHPWSQGDTCPDCGIKRGDLHQLK
mgnify:CR=1 FL=1